MPRPPKNKAIEPAKIAVAPQKQIDVDNFIRVRDSVYARLATIQDLIKSFAVDYLRQTNLLLGEGTNLEDGQQLLAGVENAFNGLIPQPVAAPAAPVEGEKKERKKRTHDPNAPKRPLTPYFLYMQTARPIIASDLGETAPKGAVQEEGQRRWAVMGPSEKAGWNQAYQYNLRLYQARMESYKAGNLAAKEMTDDQALAYANEHAVKVPVDVAIEDVVNNEQEAIAEQLGQSAVAEPEEEEEPAAPAAKTPKKNPRKIFRKSAGTPAITAPEAKAAATPASPAAKRKRTSTKAEPTEEPKKSARKKAKN
ncbi:hypothetical protein CONLIGDRAFT_126282 [Coniochaeta ligniaria NRRL 30616]|uniref:HMG box domain-containing protein n=1 Tax=Coniochaeta ligniaria NRRL 30616 TaxID=1408157 RepID=A0A1J7J4P2_9PEZI|nr:hypothetical protein CONLIGDRAFT_126282 [Coniochaeta ligniaria NRRL 30616]